MDVQLQGPERLLPDPFGAPGSRMYATEDLNRLLSDGGIEYLGSGDAQVNVRGVRIETGAIEDALSACDRAAGMHRSPRERGSRDGGSARRIDGEVTVPLRAAGLYRARRPAAEPQRQDGPVGLGPACAERRPPGYRPTWCPPRRPQSRCCIGSGANCLALRRSGATTTSSRWWHSLLAKTMAGRLRSEHGLLAAVSDSLNAESLADLGARLDASADGRDHSKE